MPPEGHRAWEREVGSGAGRLALGWDGTWRAKEQAWFLHYFFLIVIKYM